MNSEEQISLRSKGFTDAQIEEISLGMDQGLVVDVYAKKELMPQSMYQIRLGISQGFDMSMYATPQYDWFQLEEIRTGLEKGINVEKYHDPSIDSDKMQEMRLGLENHMDLSDFLKYSADIMREVRLCLLTHIDAIRFLDQGYDGAQLKIIRESIEKGLDIQRYIQPEFRDVSIQEIAIGLENGIDVESYAKPCYGWAQMQELRLGIESQVDISYYSSPLYDRYQMMEIRLGLEQGVEVNEYTSLMYPAYVMHQIREELMNNRYIVGNDEDAENDEARKEDANRDGITVNISPDKMTAYITVARESFGRIGRKEILRSLRVMGVTQNIDPRMVDNLLSGKHLSEKVQIAVGKAPVNGENGYYEYFFDTSNKRKPTILPDGSADFKNMMSIGRVKRGDTLVYYHSAGKGEDGHTVTGLRIPSKKGKDLPALRGKGYMLKDDKKTYVAGVDGRVSLRGNTLEVSQILNLKDVNQSVGNVAFDGNVMIAGTVSDGVIIEADGDVIIDGFVENATISATGNVILKQGMNGGGTASINAGRSVQGKFFEGVSIKAGEEIRANYVLNCNLYCNDSITIFGKKGLILGGTTFSTREIKVSNVGNEVGVRTNIRMGISDELRSKQIKVESAIRDKENKLLVLRKGQRDFQDKYPAEIRNTMEVYVKIENALFTVTQEKDELLAQKEAIMKEMMATAETQMVVSNILYDNVLIDIEGKKLLSTRSKNVTVKCIDNHIGIFKNV